MFGDRASQLSDRVSSEVRSSFEIVVSHVVCLRLEGPMFCILLLSYSIYILSKDQTIIGNLLVLRSKDFVMRNMYTVIYISFRKIDFIIENMA